MACTLQRLYKADEMSEGRQQLWRPRSRWEENNKTGFSRNEVEWGGLEWSSSEQVRVSGSCEQGNNLSTSIKYGEFLDSS